MIKTLTIITPSALAEIAGEMKLRGTNEVFLLFNLGSQFNHLIAQLLAKIGVFCIVADPVTVTAAGVAQIKPQGIILSGGPGSMVDNRPAFDRDILGLEIPVLGICLGFQLWADYVGATVKRAGKKEFNAHPIQTINRSSRLLRGCDVGDLVMESHGDAVEPTCVICIDASTENTAVAAGESGHLFGVQFHPEIVDPKAGLVRGERIFRNFCFDICEAKDCFPAGSVAEAKIAELAEKLTGKTVLLALSGGSDSSVVAYLLRRASERVPIKIIGVYLKGIDLLEDEEHVRRYFEDQNWLQLLIIDGSKTFLSALQGKETMPDKRLGVREAYKLLLEHVISTLISCKDAPDYIAQGTLFTDVCESGGGKDMGGVSRAKIKLHHNVNLGFSIPELMPLDDQVKDTARSIGREIGVPEALLTRHPIPGPGLTVRISGEITDGRLAIARKAEAILHEELTASGLYREIWQAGVYVTKEVHTCSKGDDQANGIILMWWAVNSVNGFTAQAARIPDDISSRISRRFENEIPEVGAVCYRTSGKPISTIEVG